MRAVLAILVGLACPLTAAAQTAGDRYGPASAVRLNQVAAEAYQGRALNWANKQATIQTAGLTLPPAPAPYRQQPVYAPFTPQVPLPLQPRAAAQPQPAASIHTPPPAQPARVQPQAPPPAQAQAQTQAHVQTPQPMSPPTAAVQPAPPVQPQRVPAMVQPGMGGATRLYSVHRGYGMTPDAIPEPQAANRYVLIGPPDAPPSAKTDDDDAPDARPGAF